MKTEYRGTARCGRLVYEQYLELSREAEVAVQNGSLAEEEANTMVDAHVREIGFEGALQEQAHVMALVEHLNELQRHIHQGLHNVFPEEIAALEEQAEEEAQDRLKDHARGLSKALAEVFGASDVNIKEIPGVGVAIDVERKIRSTPEVN